MNEMQNSQRNNSIDIFRMICAILVIIIHTRPFEDQNELLGFAVVQILPRIAVPFFFCVSGYYYFRALEKKGAAAVLETFLKAFRAYVFWSAIYFIRDGIVFLSTGSLNWKGILVEFALNFFLYGSAYHFWYFIALLLSIVVVGLFYKHRKMKWLIVMSILAYGVGVLGTAYHSIATMIPGISKIVNTNWFIHFRRIVLMGLPFFVSGVFLDSAQSLQKTKRRWLFSLIGFLTEIALVVALRLQSSIVVTVLLYPLVIYTVKMLLWFPMPQYESLGRKARSLASYMYYVHVLVIWVITEAEEKLGG